MLSVRPRGLRLIIQHYVEAAMMAISFYRLVEFTDLTRIPLNDYDDFIHLERTRVAIFSSTKTSFLSSLDIILKFSSYEASLLLDVSLILRKALRILHQCSLINFAVFPGKESTTYFHDDRPSPLELVLRLRRVLFSIYYFYCYRY